MGFFSFTGAIEIGFIYSLVALGTFISFRVLNFPDLTVDGSFPLGAAVVAVLISHSVPPWVATFVAFLAGMIAGSVTAFLNIRLSVLHILASILTMIALYSINLRIMGRPNMALFGEVTILTPFQGGVLPDWAAKLLLAGLVALLASLVLIWFLNSEIGLGLRASGANPRMARAQGVSPPAMIFLGLSLSNGLVALSGALFAQLAGFADVTLGVGTIIIGLAAVIVGETLLPSRTLFYAVFACLIGSILYRLAIAWALDIDFLGLEASDLNLITALMVTLALFLSQYRGKLYRGRLFAGPGIK